MQKRYWESKKGSGLLHDLKNPLTVIKIHLELLDIDPDYKKVSSKFRKTIDILRKEVKKMENLLH